MAKVLDFDRYRVLTFDCYGTLIDWESGILRAVRPVLAKHDVEASDEKILETYAAAEAKYEDGEYMPYAFVLRLVMTEMSFRLGFDASHEELDRISQSIKNWKPFPDTIDSLKRLKTKYKLAILSNIDDDLFAQSAQLLGIDFDWVNTAQQARAYKPSHKIFEYALAKIGLPREQILHIGQSIYHDVVPARALGLSSVWVNRQSVRPDVGATVHAEGTPDLQVPDLKTLADTIGL